MLHKGRFKISDLQPEPTRVEDNSVYIKRTKIGRFIETTHIEPVPKSSKVGRFKLSNLNTENHENFENSGNIEIIKVVENEVKHLTVEKAFMNSQNSLRSSIKKSLEKNKKDVNSKCCKNLSEAISNTTKLGIYDKNRESSKALTKFGNVSIGGVCLKLNSLKLKTGELNTSDSFKLEKEIKNEYEVESNAYENANASNSDSLVFCLSPESQKDGNQVRKKDKNQNQMLYSILRKYTMKSEISDLVRIMKNKNVINLKNNLVKVFKKVKEDTLVEKKSFFEKIRRLTLHNKVNIKDSKFKVNDLYKLKIYEISSNSQNNIKIAEIPEIEEKMENNNSPLLEEKYNSYFGQIMNMMNTMDMSKDFKKTYSENSNFNNDNTSISFTYTDMESKEKNEIQNYEVLNNDSNYFLSSFNPNNETNSMNLRIKINPKKKNNKEGKNKFNIVNLSSKNTTENTITANEIINVSMSKIESNDQIESPKFAAIESSPIYTNMKSHKFNLENLALESSKDYNNNAHNTSNITLHTIDFNEGSYFSDFLYKKESRSENIPKENIIFNWANNVFSNNNTNLLNGGHIGGSAVTLSQIKVDNVIQIQNPINLAITSNLSTNASLNKMQISQQYVQNTINFEIIANDKSQVNKNNSEICTKPLDYKLVILLIKLMKSKFLNEICHLTNTDTSQVHNIKQKLDHHIEKVFSTIKKFIHPNTINPHYDKMLDDSGFSLSGGTEKLLHEKKIEG